jgi:hypothetical protein
VKDFVGGEPSIGFAVREFSWGSLRNSFSLAETEDQPTPVKPLSHYQQSRSQERKQRLVEQPVAEQPGVVGQPDVL